MQAAESDQSLSSLIEDAVTFQMLEDLQAVKDRENEPTMKFDDFVKELKADGLL